MFPILLVGVLAGAAIHIARGTDRTRQRAGELVLVWVLAGYCGLPMVAVSVALLAWPAGAAAHLGFPPGGPVQAFMGVAYLSLSVVAVLSIWFRGGYLVAAGLAWGLFFAGATAIHLGYEAGRGGLAAHDVGWILATHALVSVVLAGALWASGVPGRTRG